jgi:hypothetical protein
MIHQTPSLFVNLSEIRLARRVGNDITLYVGERWDTIRVVVDAEEGDALWKALAEVSKVVQPAAPTSPPRPAGATPAPGLPPKRKPPAGIAGKPG